MTTKSILLAGVSVLALSTVATAADLPVKAPAPRAIVAAPVWAGAYFGISAGVSGHNSKLDLYDIWFDQGYEEYYNGPQRNSSMGFALGGYLGYNWQWGNIVAGLEADASWHSNNTSQSFMNVDSYEFGVLGSKMNGFSSFRGRWGYAVENTLVYVTGGAALVRTTNTYDVSTKPLYFSRTKWDWGWVAGAGIEHMIGNRLIVRGEVLYSQVDGGSVTGTAYSNPLTTFGVKEQDVVIGRIGAAVKF